MADPPYKIRTLAAISAPAICPMYSRMALCVSCACSGVAVKPVRCANREVPVLMIHGLDDQYLLPGALNDTWKWLEKDLTLVTVPKAGHFVHRDATEIVNKTMLRWLRVD